MDAYCLVTMIVIKILTGIVSVMNCKRLFHNPFSVCSALNDGRVEVSKLFAEHAVTDIQRVSLSGLHENPAGGSIYPMEVDSYFVHLT